MLKPRYLLDTNILIHGVRRKATWDRIKAICDPLLTDPKPLVSIVSHGEVRSFAEQNGWGSEKRDQTGFLLGYFDWYDISLPDIIDVYALLDTYSRQQGIKMGKNDLWIAATAHLVGTVLVTTDQDFDHLEGKFLTRIFISPTGV